MMMVQVLLLFGVPAILGTIFFYSLRRPLLALGLDGASAFLVGSLLLFASEAIILLAYLSASDVSIVSRELTQRLELDHIDWLGMVLILPIGAVLAVLPPVNRAIQAAVARLVRTPGFRPPPWHPVQIERPPEPDTPGYRRLLWTTVTVNVIVEELYFRAFLMGEMEFLEGGAWAVNGVLFTLYHVFQRWMWPGILPGALFGAGFFQWRGSIYPLMLGHFVGNALGLLSARQAGQRARDALPTP